MFYSLEKENCFLALLAKVTLHRAMSRGDPLTQFFERFSLDEYFVGVWRRRAKEIAHIDVLMGLAGDSP
jgi:hypothetical protein